MVNPIVSFLFYFGIAILLILSKTWIGIGVFLIVSILLLLYNIEHNNSVFKQIKPFLYFLPIFILIYIFVSWIFTTSPWIQILNEAGIAILKLLMLVFIMSIYFEISKEQNLILALRSIWSNRKLKWKWIDDMFIFFELTLRFYPSFQWEWNEINRSKKALGLQADHRKWDKVRSIANDIPGIIVQSYKKAENTAIVMKQRGYESVVPRGVANPIKFRMVDAVQSILIISIVIILTQYVAL